MNTLSLLILINCMHQILQRTDAYKYLGLLVSHELSWSDHIRTICSKAKRMLGMLYRRFYQYADSNTLLQMYISLVRPHLEYGSPVWNLYKAGDIKLIEGVQKFALRMCIAIQRTGTRAMRLC